MTHNILVEFPDDEAPPDKNFYLLRSCIPPHLAEKRLLHSTYLLLYLHPCILWMCLCLWPHYPSHTPDQNNIGLQFLLSLIHFAHLPGSWGATITFERTLYNKEAVWVFQGGASHCMWSDFEANHTWDFIHLVRYLDIDWNPFIQKQIRTPPKY